MQKKYFLTNSMQGVSSKTYLLPSFIFYKLKYHNSKMEILNNCYKISYVSVLL